MTDIAIIGAGPYGLSIAAYLRRRGISFRIFGRAMDSWVSHMPKGMLLKSDGFSSNLYDPDEGLTLGKFCAQQGIEYADAGIPVHLETFTSYGLAFKDRMVPELEDSLVVALNRSPDGFVLTLDSGEVVTVSRVVLAVGITHFGYVPETLAHLSPEFLSHSFDHHDLETFRGRSVVVIGGGASAIDLAGLLRDSDADVQLVARKPGLQFHTKAPVGAERSLWQRIRNPQSGIGTGFKLRFFADAPIWFHRLPERVRLDAVRSSLGPSGGWFAKDKLIGRVPLRLGCTPERAEVQGGQVHLHLRAADGMPQEIVTEHIIAATGYRVNLNRLKFIDSEIISSLKTVEGTPVLSSAFESSVPGLHFVGMAAANSFGPVLRFAYGAGFAARNLTRNMERLLARSRASVLVPALSEDRELTNEKSLPLGLKTSATHATEKKSLVSPGYPETHSLRAYSAAGVTLSDSSARVGEEQ
ncbi:MAG: NAD(P)-binding domain-containing protein [Terriglobales bacterium]